MPKFMVLGQEYFIEAKNVNNKALNLKPSKIQKCSHVVEVQGKTFPILQLVAEALGLPQRDLVPLDAYKILAKLGYIIEFRR